MVEKDENGLSPAEARVYRQVVKGKTNQEIADVLGLSIGGVKFQITAIYKNFKVKNRAGLLVKTHKRINKK